MTNENMYHFYFDESNKNGNIRFRNGIPNFWCKSNGFEKGPIYYVGCYVGWSTQDDIIAIKKYQEIEDTWKVKFFPGVKGVMPELKSQKLKADYSYGISSFSDRYVDFYMALFQFLIQTKAIYQINIINPLEVLTRDGLCFSFSFHCEPKFVVAFYYTLNKFLYTYSDRDLLFALENLLTTNKDLYFKNSIISKLNDVIKWDEGVQRKYAETLAFTNLKYAIELSSISVKHYPIEFDYKINAVGLKATLAEWYVHPKNVVLKIDRERDTATAIKTVFENTTEVDSKKCAGVRVCDIVAGFISNMLKSIGKTLNHDEFALNCKKASENPCILPKEWFDLTKKQFELYKIIGDFLTGDDSPYYTATTGKNADDISAFYSLLFYFEKFDTYESYKQYNPTEHMKKYNEFALEYLEKSYRRM